jgi:hypothetical protein
MTTIADFIAEADRARAKLGHSESYLSRLVFDDGKVLGRLRSGAASVTVARLDKARSTLGKLLTAAAQKREAA